MQRMKPQDYTPAAIATCVTSSWTEADLVCPVCGSLSRSQYRMMGNPTPALCGRCFDDAVFLGKPEERAAAEARRDETMARVLGFLPTFLEHFDGDGGPDA